MWNQSQGVTLSVKQRPAGWISPRCQKRIEDFRVGGYVWNDDVKQYVKITSIGRKGGSEGIGQSPDITRPDSAVLSRNGAGVGQSSSDKRQNNGAAPDSFRAALQAPTDPETIQEGVEALEIASSDVLADFGGGNGSVARAMAESGAKLAYSVEIDSSLHLEAVENVKKWGLVGRVIPIQADLFDFDPAVYGINKATAFLLGLDILDELAADGLFKSLDRLVTLNTHNVTGLRQRQSGSVLIYDSDATGILPYVRPDYNSTGEGALSASTGPHGAASAAPRILLFEFTFDQCADCRKMKQTAADVRKVFPDVRLIKGRAHPTAVHYNIGRWPTYMITWQLPSGKWKKRWLRGVQSEATLRWLYGSAP